MSTSEDSRSTPDPGVLRVRKRENPEEEKLREASRSASESAKAYYGKKKKEKKPGETSGSLKIKLLGLTLGPLMMTLVVLGLFLAHQVLEWAILSPEQATMVRNIGMASFLAVLILEAFTEDILQGVLCFFLLPYTFLYGLFFSDAGPIRGITIGVLIFLGAEMYFMPEEALVPVVQNTVNDWIRSGQDKLIYPDGRPEAAEM